MKHDKQFKEEAVRRNDEIGVKKASDSQILEGIDEKAKCWIF